MVSSHKTDSVEAKYDVVLNCEWWMVRGMGWECGFDRRDRTLMGR
jgi:hypothetical protein